MSRTGQGHSGRHSDSATDDFRSKAVEVGKNLREMGGEIGDVAREQYVGLRDRASDYVEQGRQKAQKWQEGMEGYIQERPLKSLMIAAGVGILLGLWWRRR
jgi:ElaB/YqjD/DUF883 family membrane-anchored ribosome-binding protein